MLIVADGWSEVINMVGGELVYLATSARYARNDYRFGVKNALNSSGG